jgi:hypothetical protein
MASWAAVLALSGFRYSAVSTAMTFVPEQGTFFWSNGAAWGTCILTRHKRHFEVDLSVLHGKLTLSTFTVHGFGWHRFEPERQIGTHQPIHMTIKQKEKRP